MDSLGKEPDPGGERSRPYLLHGLCLVWIALVVIVGVVRHRSVGELWKGWLEGDEAERLEVVQALAQRADSASLAEEFPRSLATQEDPRLRELAFTNLFTRRSSTYPGPRQLEGVADPAERFRCLCWLQNQTSSPRRFTYQDLDLWFAAEETRR